MGKMRLAKKSFGVFFTLALVVSLMTTATVAYAEPVSEEATILPLASGSDIWNSTTPPDISGWAGTGNTLIINGGGENNTSNGLTIPKAVEEITITGTSNQYPYIYRFSLYNPTDYQFQQFRY